MRFSRRREYGQLGILAIPSFMICLTFFAIGLMNAKTAGYLGTDQLASVAYGDIVMELTLLLFTQGFNQGLRSLGAQAFGAKNYKLVGVYVKLSLICVILASIPLSMLWYNTGILLKWVHLNAMYIEVYTKVSILSLLPRLLFTVLSTYFVVLQIAIPTAIVCGASLVLHYCLLQWLVHAPFHLGFIGIPLATAISTSTRVVIYVAYMFYVKQHHRTTWTPAIHYLSFERLRLLTKVGVPLMLGNAFENLQLQTCSLFAATFGKESIAAHSTMLQIVFALSTSIYGLNTAAFARVGYYLGQGSHESAQKVSRLHLYLILIIALFVTMFYMYMYNRLGDYFSKDKIVIQGINTIEVIAAIGYFFLSIFYYAMGTLTAQGKSLPILLAFTIGAWLVGVPMAYFLGIYLQYQLLGIWIGIASGYFVTTCIATIATLSSSWKTQAQIAVQHAHTSTETSHLLEI